MEDLAPNRVIVDIDDKGSTPIYQSKIFSTTVGFRARIELKIAQSLQTPVDFIQKSL
jgi:hypothetical protein